MFAASHENVHENGHGARHAVNSAAGGGKWSGRNYNGSAAWEGACGALGREPGNPRAGLDAAVNSTSTSRESKASRPITVLPELSRLVSIKKMY